MIEQLYKNNREKYLKIIYHKVGHSKELAEDVVQEAFLRAIKYQHTFDSDRGKIETWFNKILFNSLRDVQKQERSHVSDEPKDYSISDVFDDGTVVLTYEQRKLISEWIGRQRNPVHRRILELFFVQGYTSTEISQIEQWVSPSNVTTVVQRFKKYFLSKEK